MRHILKMMALLLCLTATAGMIGCTKDNPANSTTENNGGNNGGDNGGNNGGGTQEETYPLDGTNWVSGYFTLVFYKTDGYFVYSNPEDAYTQDITYTFDSDKQVGKINRNVGHGTQTKNFYVYGNTLEYLNMTFTKQ